MRIGPANPAARQAPAAHHLTLDRRILVTPEVFAAPAGAISEPGDPRPSPHRAPARRPGPTTSDRPRPVHPARAAPGPPGRCAGLAARRRARPGRPVRPAAHRLLLAAGSATPPRAAQRPGPRRASTRRA